MDSIVKGICHFIDIFLNPVIIIVAIVEIFFMIKALVVLIKIYINIDKLNAPEKRKSKGAKFILGGKYQEVKETYETKSWDEFEDCMKYYQDKGVWYSWYALTVQLFTLLGILGTVAGLFLALESGELNGDNLYQGVSLALSSTVLGILITIIFKSIDIIVFSKLVYHIDSGIEIFEKSYKAMQDSVFHQTVEARSNSNEE